MIPGINSSTLSFPKIGSNSKARLHKIIGKLKFFKSLVPAKCLLYIPLGLFFLRIIFSKVSIAIFFHSGTGLILYNAANAIVAKQSLNILYGCNKGCPFCVNEKYQLPFSSLPYFRKKSAPCKANFNHSGLASTF